jgi:hypothetical protein
MCVSGRRDTAPNNFSAVWAGILGNWERVEGKLERVERLISNKMEKIK